MRFSNKHYIRLNEYPFVYWLFQDPCLGNYASVVGLNSTITWDSALCELDVPSKVKFEGVEYLVRSINEGAFLSSEAEAIHLPDSIQGIYSSAFQGCHELTSIEIPEDASFDGGYIFAGCLNLKHIKMPEHFFYITEGMFSGCESLESISLPEKSLVGIGRGAFSGCHSLKSVEIPGCIGYIREDAFCNCRNLEQVIIYKKQSDINIYGRAFDEHTRVIFDPVSKNKAFKIT